MAKRPKFKVGDTVFYPSAGVGVIEAVEEIYLAGAIQSCYVIRVPETHMVVKLPVDRAEKSGVRPLLNAKKLKELFRVLGARSRKRVTGGNWTERCKEIERKINSGSFIELGEVVRDLMRWKKRSGLSFEESLLLETASGYPAREIAAVQGINMDDARNRISNSIGLQN
jgi:CarD family transcriptional regulator, regulator of rRNA transcription